MRVFGTLRKSECEPVWIEVRITLHDVEQRKITQPHYVISCARLVSTEHNLRLSGFPGAVSPPAKCPFPRN